MAEQDSLVDLKPNQSDTYSAKASDFPSPGLKARGEAEGKNTLVSMSDMQESPRALESDGLDGPSVWGKGGTAFKVGKSSSEEGTSVGGSESVDLVTGKMTCKGYKQTPVGEVGDPKVHIG